MEPILLTKPYEAIGEWFIPGSPSRRVAGTFKYSPDRIEVQLAGPLGEVFAFAGGRRVDRVFGIARDGQLFTLVDHFVRPAHISFLGDMPNRADDLLGMRAIVGAHIGAAEELYREARCRIPGLALWLAMHTVTRGVTTLAPGDETIVGLRYDVTIPAPEIDVTIRSIDASLKFSSIWVVSRNTRTSVDISTAGWLTIKPSAAKPFDWYLAQLVVATEFLAIASGSPMAPDCITCVRNDSSEHVQQLVALNEARCCPFDDESHFFLRRDALRVDLQTALASWFFLYPQIETPVKLALSSFGTSHRWNHSEFLLLMQALEGFHRGIDEKIGYIDQNSYDSVKEALVKAIPAGIDHDLRTKLISQFQYGNELSLRRRLRALANRLPESVRREILGSAGEASQSWIDTRNYLTHWDDSLREKILDGREMFYANARLRTWIRVLYLVQVEVPDGAILGALRRNSRVSQDLQGANLATLLPDAG